MFLKVPHNLVYVWKPTDVHIMSYSCYLIVIKLLIDINYFLHGNLIAENVLS